MSFFFFYHTNLKELSILPFNTVFCNVLLFTATNINIIVSEIIILFKCGNTE